MPFRLNNAPVTFQWLMETYLRDLNLNWCIIHLDYIVIFLKDLASHLERLNVVFQKLKQAGLKLKPSIKKWPTPTNVTKVQSFLGFTGYYIWFIPKLMQVAQPLHELTSGENVGEKKAVITWDDRCQSSFDDLKCLCTMASILAYVHFTRPFKLHTDACGSGLGDVLYQTQWYGCCHHLCQ